MNLNTVTKNDLLEYMLEIQKRISYLEALLQGQPIGTARIADAAITTAKIVSLSADKITTGTLSILVSISIRNEADTGDSTIIGYQEGGF
jgi:hypothetical protein